MIVKSLGIVLALLTTAAQTAELKTTSLNGSIEVTSWKALRDFRVVKQEFDYSCGAASVATLLNEFYGLDVTEADILQSIDKDATASFENMANAVAPYGFKSGVSSPQIMCHFLIEFLELAVSCLGLGEGGYESP